MPGHDNAWMDPNGTLQDVVRKFRQLPATAEIRTKWQYATWCTSLSPISRKDHGHSARPIPQGPNLYASQHDKHFLLTFRCGSCCGQGKSVPCARLLLAQPLAILPPNVVHDHTSRLRWRRHYLHRPRLHKIATLPHNHIPSPLTSSSFRTTLPTHPSIRRSRRAHRLQRIAYLHVRAGHQQLPRRIHDLA